jgi:hypothetical protein
MIRYPATIAAIKDFACEQLAIVVHSLGDLSYAI